MAKKKKKTAAEAATTKTNGKTTKGAPAKQAKTQANQANDAPVGAPPAWTFPTVPNGFSPPTTATVRRRSKPTEQMRAEGEDFANELRSGTTYEEDFGKRAPDRMALANAITVATQWDSVFGAVAPIAEYALAMRGAAWDQALNPVKKLKSAYDGAVVDEPSLAKTWKKTAAFFGAQEEPAMRGAQTRAKARRAAKKSAKVAASTNGATAAAKS